MEIEAKYTLPDRETLERLLSLTALGDYELRLAGEQEVVDRYYDTPEGAVRAGGYALRLRENKRKGRWRGALKGLGGAEGALHRREEHEVDVPAGALPAEWPPSPARDLALGLMGGVPLSELFSVYQVRHKREVWAGGVDVDARRLVAELSADEAKWVAGEREAAALELEIELGEAGTQADLEALAAALGEYELRPQPRSKFERGLEVLAGGGNHEVTKVVRDTKGEGEESNFAAESAEPAAPRRAKSAGVRADEPMAEAGRKVLRFHFDRMREHEAGTRLGEDIEALHDMRVAIRRQRAALLLFGGYFRPKAIRPFAKALRAAGRRLGAVRDLDVLLEAAREYQAGLAEPAALALQPVLDAWAAEREAARAAMLAHLDGAGFARFKEECATFLAAEGAGVRRPDDPHAPTLVRDLLPARLWEHYGAVRAYAPTLPGAPIETLHALRIAGKRLRYALEFFAEALDPSLRDAIRAMVRLQDHLGALNDASVTLARLHAYLQAADPRPAPETVLAVGAYMRVQQASVRRLRRGVGRPWRAVAGKRIRRLLGRAVAGL
jgi:CHAD domain-containing protein